MDIKSFMMEVVGDTKEVILERFSAPFVIEAISETENDRLKKFIRTSDAANLATRLRNWIRINMGMHCWHGV